MRSTYRTLLIGFALSLLTQMLPVGVAAQTDQIDELRANRDAVRAERARAAADLDPLLAANDDIEESLRLLEEDLSARQAALDATNARLDKARNDVAVAHQQVADEQADIAALRVELQEQAINAYVQPRGGALSSQVLAASDINDGERRRALVSAVSTSQNDILDQLRAAEANMEIAATRAEAAGRDIAVRAEQAVAQLEEVDRAIVDQQRLRAILDARIAEFQAEVDAHADDEDALSAQLVGLIVEEEARQEAIREAARIQAERERVAREEAQLAADIAAGRVSAQSAVNRADAALTSAPTAAVGSLIWPISGAVTSSFGPRWGRMHNGIDVSANVGTPVVAAGSGQVISAGRSGGFGNLVVIDHGGGLASAYAHLNSINVSAGQRVSAGNSVGTVGTTGNSTGPHLHFETRVAGVAYNPLQYLA